MAANPAPRHAFHFHMRAFALVLLLVQMASAKRYQYQKYSELVAKMIALQSEHPTMLRLFTAQDRYGLPAVGNCASSDTKGKCLVYSILLTNLTSLEADPGLLITRPSLFISGTLHGNEWIGPQASVGFAEYMLKQQSKRWIKFLLNTRIVVRADSRKEGWDVAVATSRVPQPAALACGLTWRERAPTSPAQVIVPMANADGYFHGALLPPRAAPRRPARATRPPASQGVCAFARSICGACALCSSWCQHCPSSCGTIIVLVCCAHRERRKRVHSSVGMSPRGCAPHWQAGARRTASTPIATLASTRSRRRA